MAPRIVIFSCQWAPHYALQSLYRRGRRGEGDGVRVLTACVGRIGEDVVLEAFRLGTAGVAVLSCLPGHCRHGLDQERFHARVTTLRAIIETLGIPADRLLVGAFHPHEGEQLAECLEKFVTGIGTAAGVER
jgi:coenzyme F420-reducing hydrogenase delta subunit